MSKEGLRKMIEGEEVRVKTVGQRKYARAVARVYQERESINKKMKKQIK